MNDGEYFDEKEKVALGIPLFGTTFMRTFPWMNNDKWIFDKDGNSITTGEVGVENITPFQVLVDSLGDRLNKKRWIIIRSLKAKEWVEDIFKVKVTASNSQATDNYRKLMKVVAQVSPWKGAGIDSSSYSVDDDSLVLFNEMELKPTIKYPEGRYVIGCGDKLLKQYPRMPVKMDQGKWFYSLTDFHFDYLPGAFWSDAGVNNIISPQNSINSIDQGLEINRKGVARPKLFVPGNIGIKKMDDVGGLGVGMLVLEYDPLLSGGQKPNIEQGTPLPQQVLEERNIHRRTIQDVSGDPKNILRGESPGSKASGIMVDILRETAERGHYPDMDRFTRSMTRVDKKRLILAQEIMTEESILKTCGRGNKWSITKFKAADLRSNTDIRLELDSGLATTNAGKMAVLSDFAQKGILGDVTQNSELRQELLRRSGLSGFTEQENVDLKRAELENAKMGVGDFEGIFIVDVAPGKPIDANTKVAINPATNEPMNDPMFKYDNHPIHKESHKKFILSEEFSELPPQSQIMAMNHTDIHNWQVVEAQKNVPPEPHDPREFVQMDKLYPLLTRNEQMQVLQELNIEPDPNAKIVGMLTAKEKLDAAIKKIEVDDKLVLETKKIAKVDNAVQSEKS